MPFTGRFQTRVLPFWLTGAPLAAETLSMVSSAGTTSVMVTPPEPMLC